MEARRIESLSTRSEAFALSQPLSGTAVDVQSLRYACEVCQHESFGLRHRDIQRGSERMPGGPCRR